MTEPRKHLGALAAGALLFVAPASALAEPPRALTASLGESAEPDQPAPAIVTKHHARFLSDRDADQKLQDIGWALVTGNAPFCTAPILAAGLRLQDARAFGSPSEIRKILGRDTDFTVRTVAAGSPAFEAGIRPGMALLSIDGDALNAWPTDADRPWARYQRAHDLIDQSLASTGVVVLTFEGGVTHTLAGAPSCSTRFEMETRSDTALADGKRVRLGRDFPAFDDARDEFAAIIAHELAHNLLRHRAWLDANGRTRGKIRSTEREADRLMPWLLANAGYDPEAALRFMKRWGPQTETGLFRARTHEHWKKRMQTIAAEIPLVREAMADGSVADWSSRFQREISP